MDRQEEEKVVTIRDRSITFIPVELESSFQFEPFCVACKATDKPLLTCSSCKLVSFCSKECQAADWVRHKKEEHCGAIRKVRRRLEQAEETIRRNSSMLATEAIGLFGEDAFLDRPVQDVHQIGPDEIFDLIAGRFMYFSLTQHYMQHLVKLYEETLHVASSHDTRIMWERVLELTTEIKRITHVSAHDFDQDIPLTLLRLHRNDDANSYMYFWMGWQAHREETGIELLGNPQVVQSIKGEWPYLCGDGARMVDLSEYIAKYNVRGRKCPVQIVMIALAIKLRYVCVYRKLAEGADAFRSSQAGQTLPPDVTSNVASFLNGGKLRARNFGYQWDDVNKLLNYIDDEYPHVLPSVLDTNLLPQAEGAVSIENENFHVTDLFETDGQSFHLRRFLETWERSPPVLAMLTDILKLRYGYSERGLSVENEDEWSYSWETVVRKLDEKKQSASRNDRSGAVFLV